MSTQQKLGWALAEAGIAKADAAEANEWKAKADFAIEQLAASGQEFTAENVRLVAGDPSRPNAFGARFLAAKRAGLIRHVGYKNATRPSRHTHPIKIWIST